MYNAKIQIPYEALDLASEIHTFLSTWAAKFVYV